jgi:hypothetical protein
MTITTWPLVRFGGVFWFFKNLICTELAIPGLHYNTNADICEKKRAKSMGATEFYEKMGKKKL